MRRLVIATVLALGVAAMAAQTSISKESSSRDNEKVRKCTECCAQAISGIKKVDWNKALPPVEERCFGGCAAAFRQSLTKP